MIPDEVVDRVRAGSVPDLAHLYEVLAPSLYQLAYRITMTRQDAEDVVHDVFVGLPTMLRSYRTEGRFVPWIRRLTVRVALMRMRSDRRRDSRNGRFSTGQADVVYQVDGSDDQLEQALWALPKGIRAVVVLREVEGQSHPEIARLLGISQATSRIRLWRGLRRLRELLEAEYQ